MSNYIEHNYWIVFHPGYYLKEIIDESGLTKEDFAGRLSTTPENLSILLWGEQRLSVEMASRLSGMLGTTAGFWLGLQQAYDEKVTEFLSAEELYKERETLNWSVIPVSVKTSDYRIRREKRMNWFINS